MGEVFLAHDEVLDRPVALKLLRREFGHAPRVALLEHEARVLARLSHPNVVQVHELGRHGDRAYLAMEYLEGLTLTAWLVAMRPGWRAILSIFAQAGRGLAAAHAIGLVHRDFKPDNVLVGADGRTRVVDFGLADRIDDATIGNRAGTPRYMAPEQLAGKSVDARSDQFAFCVALAEALWGVPLRDGTRGPPPSVIPRWSWRVIRRGLRADPDRRWPDMDSLLRALDPGPRHRRQAVIALGLVGVLGSFAWPESVADDRCASVERELDPSWSGVRADQVRAAATRQGDSESIAAESLIRSLDEWASAWRAARVRTCRAGAIGSEVGLREACLTAQRRRVAAFVDFVLVRPEQLPAHVRELAHALPQADSCELDAALQRGIELPSPAIAEQVEDLRGIVDRATAARLLGRAEAELPALERGVERAEQLGHRPVLAELQAELGSAELLAGSTGRGVAWLERASRTAYIARDDRLAGDLWIELSSRAVDRGDLNAATLWLERASDTWMRLGVDARARGRLDYATGLLALAQGEIDAAELALQAALAGPEPGLRPFVLERMAELAGLREDRARAIELHEQARDAASLHFGPEHPRTAQQRYNLALALRDAGSDARAELEFARAIASWQRAHVRPHDDLATAHMLLAMFALDHRQLDEALVHAERARTILAELHGEADATLASAWTTLGAVRQARGEFEAAAEAFDRACTIFDAALGETDASSLQAASNHGASLLALGQLDQAEARFERVLAASSPDAEPAQIVATLGLAEIELRREQPGRAATRLSAIELDDSQDPIDRLDHALLLGLAAVRAGRQPDVNELARARVDAGELGRVIVERLVANLGIAEAERVQLGL